MVEGKDGQVILAYLPGLSLSVYVSPLQKGGEIPRNRVSVVEGNLTIIGIQMSDRGTYECKATNEAATITSESELLVEESVKTHAPYNVTTDVTKDSVTVKWLAGYTRPKLKFSVW